MSEKGGCCSSQLICGRKLFVGQCSRNVRSVQYSRKGFFWDGCFAFISRALRFLMPEAVLLVVGFQDTSGYGETSLHAVAVVLRKIAPGICRLDFIWYAFEKLSKYAKSKVSRQDYGECVGAHPDHCLYHLSALFSFQFRTYAQ